ncbi:hypothetical protein LTR56_008149 [Elasticomyces elasticus]|nr:hypothetical protein LTR56_008149 [Elasticomyces elasticus]KAK3662901.1 hypothetical protein LTR22_006304 [Elasticomyces elasticus]KAK4930096.1 hypothetical protein LTR49_003424 [Elasticomyces elasticus]
MAELTAAMAATSLAPSRPSFFDETYAQAAPNAKRFPSSVDIRTNYFQISTTNLLDQIYVYSFAFPTVNNRNVANKNVKKEFIRLVLRDVFFQHIRHECVTDWNGMLVSLRELENEPGAQFTATTSRPFVVTWHNQSQPLVPVTLTTQLRRTQVLLKADIRDFCTGVRNHDCSNWLNALNVLARTRAADQTQQPVAVKDGREKYFPLQSVGSLGFGLEARQGHLSSIRAFSNGLAMNVHGVATAFITPRPLLQYLASYEPEFRVQGQQTMTNAAARRLDADFKMIASQLQVRYLYTPPDPANPQRPPLLTGPTGRLKRVNGFGLSARLQTFRHSTLGLITVENYFNAHILPPNQPLRHPHLLVINTGPANPAVWVPPELLWVEAHQAKRGVLREGEMARMLNHAQRGPLDNILEIERVMGAGGIFDTTALLNNGQGLIVSPTMKTVKAGLMYGTGKEQSCEDDGRLRSTAKWNIIGKKFWKAGPTRLDTLGVIDFGRGTDADVAAYASLAQALTRYGIPSTGVRQVERQSIAGRVTPITLQQAYDALVQRAGQLPVILIILPASQGKHDYATVKTWGDSNAGVNTVCITNAKLRFLSSGGFQGNIALKFNIKLRGENHKLTATSDSVPPSTIVFGADVTHPTGGSVDYCPSVAAVVASCDGNALTYPGSLRLQKSKQEMIENLDDMVCERLTYWNAKNGKLPDVLLFYRDGVSEGQFSMVKRDELPKIRRGAMLAADLCGATDYQPRITVVVCDKRHHTRFFPPKEALPKDKTWMLDGNSNFKPGLLVEDPGIRSPYYFDFYLQSHSALKGTARPCHYFVIENGIGVGPEQLQRITFNLCWTYATALTPISLVAPAYYADRLAERGACYLRPLLVTQHPDRPNSAQLMGGLAANATEDQKAQHVCDLIASGVGVWNNFWPTTSAGRTNPQMPAVADTMFYI